MVAFVEADVRGLKDPDTRAARATLPAPPPRDLAGRALQLQRAAGNRAVASILAGRRLARKQLTRPEAPSEGLGAIVGAVDAYNAKESGGRPEERLGLLRALDRALFAWYAAMAKPTIEGADTPVVGELVTESEDEFADVVDAHKGAILPIDTTTMGGADIAAARTLWQSICAYAGRILVQGSPEYVKRTRANLAKNPRRTHRPPFAHVSGPAREGAKPRRLRSRRDLRRAPRGARDLRPDRRAEVLLEGLRRGRTRGGSRAGHPTRRVDVQLGDLVHPVGRPADARPSRADPARGGHLRRPDGREGADKSFTFAKGATGAFVHTIRPWDMEQDIANRAGSVAYTPEFITLAHELGHAMHHLAGATVGKAAPIRAESGLQVRAKHETLPSVKSQEKKRRMDALGARVQRLYKVIGAEDKPAFEKFMIDEYSAAGKGDRPQVLVDTVYAKLDAHLTALELTYAEKLGTLV